MTVTSAKRLPSNTATSCSALQIHRILFVVGFDCNLWKFQSRRSMDPLSDIPKMNGRVVSSASRCIS
jgi:hypothetical protein